MDPSLSPTGRPPLEPPDPPLLEATARQRLAAIVESSDDAIISKSLDGVIESWNRGAEKLFGYREAEIVGQSVLLLIPPERRSEERRILERIRAGQRVEPYDTVRCRKDGSRVEISLSVSPVRDGVGRIVGASKIARDITERKRAERELARRAEEHAALFELAERLQRATARAEILEAGLGAVLRALGCPRAAIFLLDDRECLRLVAGRGLSEGSRPALEGHAARPRDAHEPGPMTIGDVTSGPLDPELRRLLAADGIAALAYLPLVVDGRLIGELLACYDAPRAIAREEIDVGVTLARQLALAIDKLRLEQERRRAEEQRELLVAELNHRVKNTLAIVVSIARQTFGGRSVAAAARDAFEGRLRALAQTHTRLAEKSWEGAALEAILRDELAPFAGPGGLRVRLEGPPVTLAARLSVSLGMAFHELATNAAKHGALSVPGGRVEVGWQVESGGERLSIAWTESGGPPVAPPSRTGFGRLLLEQALPSYLAGGVEMRFPPEGLKCRISVPLESGTAWPA